MLAKLVYIESLEASCVCARSHANTNNLKCAHQCHGRHDKHVMEPLEEKP